MKTIQSIFDELGGVNVVKKEMHVSTQLAHYWYRHDSLPGRYWARLVRLARRKGVSGVNLTALSKIAEG